MKRDDSQFRYARVVLLVEWDPESSDHPQGWDWEALLGIRAEVLEAEDLDQAERGYRV